MKNDYVKNASIISRTVRDLEALRPLYFHPDIDLRQAVDELLSNPRGAAGVVDADCRLMGMVTERQVLRYIFGDEVDANTGAPLSLNSEQLCCVRDIMIAEPECLNARTPLDEALTHMSGKGYRYMPIVDNEHNRLFLGVVHVQELYMSMREKQRRDLESKDALLAYLMSGENYGGYKSSY